MFNCKVIADTICNSNRITTVEITYPRIIHAEIMTHRDRARNAGSSRAIPWPTMCERIQNDPFVPIYWGEEKSGMQTGKEIENVTEAENIWLRARNHALRCAQELSDLGVHKSICNRLTEPWMYITVVMTSTSWRNFFLQRCHKDAETHFQKIAGMMKESLIQSVPREGTHHLPYIQADDFMSLEKAIDPVTDDPFELLMQVSTARCARVSYVQHGSKVKSIALDLKLYSRLVTGSGFGHWSPSEHPAIQNYGNNSGCYKGWKPYRKFFTNECPEEGYLLANSSNSV